MTNAICGIEFGGCAVAKSRSDAATVAVGFNPRWAIRKTAGVAERRTNAVVHHAPMDWRFMRRSATHPSPHPEPWVETHGYRHVLAPRGEFAGASVASNLDPRSINHIFSSRSVGFARVVNATNGRLHDPVTNLSTFP